MASICKTKLSAFFLTMVPVFGAFALNLVAREIELPFGDDANDLPLYEFQDHMNNSMLMLIREEADHVPCIAPNVDLSWDSAKSNVNIMKPRDFVSADFVEQCSAGKERTGSRSFKSYIDVDVGLVARQGSQPQEQKNARVC
jgi:hypothetical protein